MKKRWNNILQTTTTLIVAIVLIYAFFCVGLSHNINVWEYFLNGIEALFSEQEVLVYFAVQIGYFIGVYFIFKRIKFYDIFDYFREVITATVFILYGMLIILEITNSFLTILVIISILSYICMVITFILKLSLRIYKLDKTDSQFNIFRTLYKYKIESLIAILVISSQLLILIYGFAYFRYNTLLSNDIVNMGIMQDKSIIKNFIDIYYFSSVTFFTVGYGDILPQGDKLKLLVISEMITGFIMNTLYVPAVLVFIINLFDEKKRELKSKPLHFKPWNMSNLIQVPCFTFQDVKDFKYKEFREIERIEFLDITLTQELNIIHNIMNVFYLDIVDDSLSMLNIYNGDKLLIFKQVDLITDELGVFFLDNDSKKIILGHVVESHRKGDDNITEPVKWVEGYWNNCCVHAEKALPIGKVIYIKRKHP